MEIRVHPDVAAAVERRQPVVALESTLIAHGLTRPDNHVVAEQIERQARSRDAQPATIAMLGGIAHVGLDAEQLTLVTGTDMAKLSERDLAVAAAKRVDGATTVAATATVAASAGIAVFATGGLGGVHRDANISWDVSADLLALSRTPVVVVCAGVKSILDIPATVEHLETLGVTVIGYRTRRFPGFYLTDGGIDVGWTVDDVDEIAAIYHGQRALNVPGALVVVNPLPPDRQLDPDLHDRSLSDGLIAAVTRGVTGAALTPFLLAQLHETTGGRSLAVNIDLVLRNVSLAADIAAAVSRSARA